MPWLRRWHPRTGSPARPTAPNPWRESPRLKEEDELGEGARLDLLPGDALFAPISLLQELAELGEVVAIGDRGIVREAPLQLEMREEGRHGVQHLVLASLLGLSSHCTMRPNSALVSPSDDKLGDTCAARGNE